MQENHHILISCDAELLCNQGSGTVLQKCLCSAYGKAAEHICIDVCMVLSQVRQINGVEVNNLAKLVEVAEACKDQVH